MFKHEWFTPAEVAIHNKQHDCWVSLNGKVLDLSRWLQMQFRVCQCTKACTCAVKDWLCEPNCVEKCQCFKRGYLYCDGKRVGFILSASI